MSIGRYPRLGSVRMARIHFGICFEVAAWDGCL